MSIYRKTLSMHSSVRQDIGIGKIINIMSADADKVLECSWQFHLAWSSLLQILSINFFCVKSNG
jgi:hypothetical protein